MRGHAFSLLPNLQPKKTKPARLERGRETLTDARDGVTKRGGRVDGELRGRAGQQWAHPRRAHQCWTSTRSHSLSTKVHLAKCTSHRPRTIRSHVNGAPPRPAEGGQAPSRQTPITSVGEEKPDTTNAYGPTHFSAYLSKKKQAGSPMEGGEKGPRTQCRTRFTYHSQTNKLETW